MELPHLKTFYHLGMIRNFTETAHRLYITQSAVSHSLKKLEKSLGVTLVEKKRGSYELTEYGEMLFNVCQNVFSQLDNVEEQIKNRNSSEPVTVILGVPVEFGSTVLISSMTPFLEQNPGYHIEYVFSHNLFDPLLKDELDIMIDCRLHTHPGIKSVFLCNEPYTVVASPDYVSQNKIRTIDDFHRARILSLDADAAWWENFLICVPGKTDIQIERPIVINHVRGLINGAIHGMGISLVPRYTIKKELVEKYLVEIFTEIRARDDQFRIYIKKEKFDSTKNQVLVNYLKHVFSDFE